MATWGIRSALARAALAGVLVVGVAACGNDDDGDGETTTDAGDEGAAPDDYCDNLVEFNAAVLQSDVSPEATEEEIAAVSEELSPSWTALRDSAPASVSDEVAPLDAVMVALEDGDAGPFNAEETFVQYTELIDGSIDECDFETASVEAGDFYFEGIPDDLSQGTVAVRLTNVAEVEVHEFVVFRKNDPAQPADEILAMDDAAMEEVITFAGATFALPGETGAGLMEFSSGSYLAVCFIPVGGEDGPPHFTAGQLAEFTVE
jgi:hypothetical protein